MAGPSTNTHVDKSLVAALILVLVFATPFISLWSHGGWTWYIPYLLWLGTILFIAFCQRYKDQGNKEP